MPGADSAASVGYLHAFVTLNVGAAIDLAGMQAYLRTCPLTPQYWPEHLEIRAELPRTPSGKVQLFKLREIVAELAGAGRRRPGLAAPFGAASGQGKHSPIA